MKLLSGMDDATQKAVRHFSRTGSRRGFLSQLGVILVGGGALPLLPIARADAAENNGAAQRQDYPGVAPHPTLLPGESGDLTSCDYWRYCGVGGNLCSCCGGGPATCPAGTEMSPMGWLGTCTNPADQKRYIISYNDCCGKPSCTRCLCAPDNPANKPPVRPQASNEYLWCLGTSSSSYTCSTATVVGLAVD